jgi:2'-5' RNA ligase
LSAAVQRLFVALWPDDATRAEIVAATGNAIGDIDGRRVPAANLHVTLVFIGNWPVARRGALEAALSRVAISPIELDLEFLSFWPRPRAIVLEAARVPPQLLRLVMQLSEAVERFGWQRQMRPYRPHVTLVRKSSPVEAMRLPEPVHLRANAFSLVASEPGRDGVVYRPLRTWPAGNRG